MNFAKQAIPAALVAIGVFVSGQAFSADQAKKQLEAAPKQSGNVTFDGSRPSGPSSGSTPPSTSTTTARTPQQAIQDSNNSRNTTAAQQKAIDDYKNSGKSRSGK